MRENKRRRYWKRYNHSNIQQKLDDELDGVSAVDEESNYPNESAAMALRPEENLTVNQPITLNQSVFQNQQLVYQIQKVGEEQNLVYFLLPSNESLQVPLPVSSLSNEQSASDNSIVYTAVSNQIANDPPIYIQTAKPETTQHDSASVYVDQQVGNVNQCNFPKTIAPHLYRCDYSQCSVTFSSLYEKKVHVESHTFQENNEFKCSICNAIFQRAADRNKHVEMHAVAPTYKCKECKKDFAYFTVLIKHLKEKRYSSKNRFTCFFCETQITDYEEIIKHHQLNMKQCECGTKKCGTQVFQLHTGMCELMRSKESEGVFEKKRLKMKRI